MNPILSFFKNIKSELNYGINFILGEEKDSSFVATELVSTGSKTIDTILGIGGYPCGTMVEIFGEEGCGKTTLALYGLKQAQLKGALPLFVDVEQSLTPHLLQSLEIDLKRVLIVQAPSGETTFKIVNSFLQKSAQPTFIVIDSLASLLPKYDLIGEIERYEFNNNNAYNNLFRLSLKQLFQTISERRDSILLFVNHIHTIITEEGETLTITPWNYLLKFYASIRIGLKKRGFVYKENNIIGIEVEAEVIKNRFSDLPMKKGSFQILFGYGITE